MLFTIYGIVADAVIMNCCLSVIILLLLLCYLLLVSCYLLDCRCYGWRWPQPHRQVCKVMDDFNDILFGTLQKLAGYRVNTGEKLAT